MPPITLEEVTEDRDNFAAPVSDSQRNRLGAQILRSLRHGTNREFLRHASLAPTVTTVLLETTLAWCARSCEPTVARRARYVLTLIGSAQK
jgi:hypothetical protein